MTELHSCTKFVCRQLDNYRKGQHHISFNRLNAVSSIYVLSDTSLIFVLRAKETSAVKWLENLSLLQPCKYISGVSMMIEVHFHIFAQRNIYIFGVENGSLCICCLEDESTMYLVEGFEKRFNNKNALSFSPTGFSQNCHLRKLPFETDLTTNIHV